MEVLRQNPHLATGVEDLLYKLLARARVAANGAAATEDGDRLLIRWAEDAAGSVAGGYYPCVLSHHPESGEPFVYGRDRDAGWWDEPVSFERDEDDWRADPEFAWRGPLAQAKLTFLRRAIVGRLNARGCVMAPFHIPTLDELHAWFETTLASRQYANAK